MPKLLLPVAIIAVLAACARESRDPNGIRKEPPPPEKTEAQRVAQLNGLHMPESVRYDPELDVYYISNMTGYGSAKDGNGYIIRTPADNFSKASILVEGGKNGAVLDAPKGIALHGDTLWVTDIDVLRGFDRKTGATLATIDLKGAGAVLLNDVVVGGDGKIYITDTGIIMSDKGVLHPGGDKIFAIGPNGPSVLAHGDELGRPNGITWDSKNQQLLVASFDPFHSQIYSIKPGNPSRPVIAQGDGKFDGLEILPDGRTIVASWNDSAVLAVDGKKFKRLTSEVWAPADIGVDTRRNRIAIPSGIMNRVELWQLPRSN
ncbi:MAG TPA: SMP-30/gluconolactonase/LRE family protein [Gemmatimonadaceae bacterium]|nr:SMP-30/gluconolactonase/LRE family protein [Gemmatimonadaceae bacterium]